MQSHSCAATEVLPKPSQQAKIHSAYKQSFYSLAQCLAAESSFSMHGKFLLESGRTHARPYEMPAQWQEVKVWYQEILWNHSKTNFLKALCYLGRHRFMLLGKASKQFL